jgi:hypothetical protein
MGDEPVFELAEPPKKRPFLGANSRTPDGDAMFPKVGDEATFECVAIEPFVKDGTPQPALILQDMNDGTEYIRVVGKTNQYQLGALGLKTVNEAVGNWVVFQSYDTGSTGPFQFGLRITAVRPVTKKEK